MRAILLLAACASSTPTSTSDMAVQPLPDLSTSGMTNQQYCDAACATLALCGVQFGAGCSTGCQLSNTFLPCIKMADLSNCNAISLCSFQQYAHDFCAAGSGVPNGTGTCKASADCEGACNINQPGVAQCPCACIAGLLPIKASALLINNQCALAKCSTECGPTGSGAACNTCAANMCATEYAQCAAQ